jgi:hypothetical protein
VVGPGKDKTGLMINCVKNDKDEWFLGRSPAEANPSKQNKFVELKRLEHLEI